MIKIKKDKKDISKKVAEIFIIINLCKNKKNTKIILNKLKNRKIKLLKIKNEKSKEYLNKIIKKSKNKYDYIFIEINNKKLEKILIKKINNLIFIINSNLKNIKKEYKIIEKIKENNLL